MIAGSLGFNGYEDTELIISVIICEPAVDIPETLIGIQISKGAPVLLDVWFIIISASTCWPLK